MVTLLRYIFLIILIQTYGVLAQQPVWRPVLGEGSYYNEIVSAVDVYPSDPDTVFALTSRRLLLSTNRGESWDSISEIRNGEGAFRVHATTSKIMYAAIHSSSILGNDIIQSTDGGIAWTKKFPGMTFPVRTIERDPLDPAAMYVCLSAARIQRTTDYGETWTPLTFTGAPFTTALAIASSNSNILYTAALGRIHRSTDRGGSWVELNLGFQIQSGVRLAVDPRDSEIIYAGLYSDGSFPGGMYKSTNGGSGWFEINVGLADSNRKVYELKMNPKNPSELFLGLYSGDFAVYRSSDAGASWHPFSEGLPSAQLHVLSIAIDTSINRLYLGVGGGYGLYVCDLLSTVGNEASLDPLDFEFYQNFPNPFNPSTELRVGLAKSGNITLAVYDVLGREVTTVARGFYQAGNHAFTWNAEGFASGIYIARMALNDNAGRMKFTRARKMLLLR